MKPREGVWLVPFLYGLLQFLAGAMWLVEGMPFVAGALAVSYRSFFPGPRAPADRGGR